MNDTPMTIADVKRDLPMVKIKFNGKLFWGKVTGRLNQFATVSPFILIDNRSNLVKTIMGPCYTYSWDAVTRSINTGKPLIT